MAQWWELAIPAAGTLLGAGLGAGSQLILRGRQERHERAMRLVDEKLRVYGRIVALIGDLPAARAGAERADESMRPYENIDPESISDPAEMARIGRIADRAADDNDVLVKLIEELITLIASLRIWGPVEVAELALQLNDAYRDGRADEAEDLQVALILAIRDDLRVEGPGMLARLRRLRHNRRHQLTAAR